MNWKYSLTLVSSIAVLGLVGLIVSRSSQNNNVSGIVVAGTPTDGVEVPGMNGKVRAYENGVYHVEPSNFAISPAVRDIAIPDEETAAKMRLEPTSRDIRKKKRDQEIKDERVDKGLPPMTDDEKQARDINDLNTRALKKLQPGAGADAGDGKFTDPLLSNQPEFNAPQAMPTPSVSFNGASATDNATVGVGGLSPPDVNGDVGPNHYVSSINLALKFFNKNGTVAAGPIKTSDLWAALPPTDLCRTRNDGDPHVIYDQLADRWHISQFSVPSVSTNFQCVAISTTGDPTGTYYLWSYAYPGNIFNDYPKVGVWNDAYHMTFNQFNNAGTLFLGLGFLSQDRPRALTGDPTASVVYTNIATIDPDAGGALPLDIEGFVPPPANLPMTIAEFRADEFGDPADALRFYKWIPNFVTPGSSTVTVLTDVPLAAFDARQPSGRTDIEQQGGTSLDAIPDRLMHRLVYRNRGTYDAPVNAIVGSFSVNTSGVAPTNAATYTTGIRWFELRRTGDTFSVFDQGTHADPGTSPVPTPSPGARLNNWMSSATQDNQGNIAVGFSQSGPAQNADIKIAGRTSNLGGAGVLNEGEAMFHDALGSQTGSSRWGDYSMMSLDPVDDCTFWYTQEYFAVSSSVGWSTRVGSFKFPSCTAAPKGTISGTITGCSSGLPIDDANVTATGGFQRLTIANGSYSMDVTPGNYALSADKAPGFLSNSANTVVTNGNTATVNLCLTGVAVLSPGTATIINESCGLPNTLPDPGEVITVSLPITNNGGAGTSNLVATLRNTGGVIDAPAGQSYGAIAAQGGSASRDFTFRVQPGLACGSTLTLTWDLVDGATNFGTIVKTFGTGTPVVNLTQNFDGVTPPALPAGWTQVQTSGTGINWVTQATTPASAPNSAFANTPTTVNATALVSPAINISSATASVTFQNNFDLEFSTTAGVGFDGMVLEIKIGAGAFQDILTAGGSFAAGGYNRTISGGFSSPIAGRQAWSGNSGGYITSTANLPAAANGQSIQLRWLVATDSSAALTGARIDSIQVLGGVACQGPCAPPRPVRADFDGDGRTDLSIYRPSTGDWWVNRTTDGIGAINWGISGDTPISADFSGDKEADFGIFRGETDISRADFWLLNTPSFTHTAHSWGLPGDIPFAGDYNGDGNADVSVYRNSENVFYIFIRDTVSSQRLFRFGLPGDIPLAGDFDGDGKTDVATYRPGTGTWYFADAEGDPGSNVNGVQFGLSTDKPVHADYDGDDKDDVAVYRPSTGEWFILYSDTLTVGVFKWGISTDVPVPGDYDGDGRYDIAIYRNGEWWIIGSTAGPSLGFWGLASDIPIPNTHLPQIP